MKPLNVKLITNKEIQLLKGVYMNNELNTLIGFELKSQLVSCDYVIKKNKLAGIMEMVISFNKLNNSDGTNLEDGNLAMSYLGIT